MNEKEAQRHYDDIIHLSRPAPSRPRMTAGERAAQFSPFAALTGHGDAIRETARLTNRRIALDEDSRQLLDEKLLVLSSRLREHPAVAVTYFIQDEQKDGGTYVTVSGSAKKIDRYAGHLILADGTKIPLEDVVELDTETDAEE